VRFWDASALVALVVEDLFSEQAWRWNRDDPEIAAWCLSPAEIWSAVARRRRDGKLNSPEVRKARENLAQLMTVWNEVTDVVAVRQRSLRLLDVHRLRSGDALQLGAALVAVEDHPVGAGLVTTDARLAAAAEIEGFRAIGVEPE
jgi:predicted nucleic acid-binding protein